MLKVLSSAVFIMCLVTVCNTVYMFCMLFEPSQFQAQYDSTLMQKYFYRVWFLATIFSNTYILHVSKPSSVVCLFQTFTAEYTGILILCFCLSCSINSYMPAMFVQNQSLVFALVLVVSTVYRSGSVYATVYRSVQLSLQRARCLDLQNCANTVATKSTPVPGNPATTHKVSTVHKTCSCFVVHCCASHFIDRTTSIHDCHL